jgi:hypothetical protein
MRLGQKAAFQGEADDRSGAVNAACLITSLSSQLPRDIIEPEYGSCNRITN